MRRSCKSLGVILAGTGLLILFAIILPWELWWILLGLGLICGGVLLCRC